MVNFRKNTVLADEDDLLPGWKQPEADCRMNLPVLFRRTTYLASASVFALCIAAAPVDLTPGGSPAG